nr:membrane dipeptidase [uncultured Shimia sp.]
MKHKSDNAVAGSKQSNDLFRYPLDHLKKLALLFLTLALSSAISPAFAITDEEVEAKKQTLSEGVEPRTEEERSGDIDVIERYKDAIVIDALIPGTPEGYVDGTIADYEAMVARSREHAFDAVSYTAAVDDTFEPLQIVQWIGKALEYYAANSDRYQFVETVDDLRRAKSEGKFAVMLNFQGSNALGGEWKWSMSITNSASDK